MKFFRATLPLRTLSRLVVGGVTLVSACNPSPENRGDDDDCDDDDDCHDTGDASSTASDNPGLTSTGEPNSTSTGAPNDTASEPNPTSTGAPDDTTGEPSSTSTGAPDNTTGEPNSTSTGAPDNTTGDGTTTSSGTTDASSSGSSSTGEAAPPEATPLQLTFSPIKQFEFNWAAAQGATYYQLLERPTPADCYQQIGGDIADLSLTLTMPLHLRFGASYILSACNGDGCTDSAPVEVVDSLASAVGYFKASNTGASDRFGLSLSLSADGTTLAVGAMGEASSATGIDGDPFSNTSNASGAVYVFVRKNGAWSQQAYVKASNTQTLDNFGVSVALSADGNTLAVGAQGEASGATGIDGDQTDGTALNAGAVYVFTRAGAVWSQQAYVKASNTSASDWFGSKVALSGDGDTLAVGAYGEDGGSAGVNGDQNNGGADTGAVYLFGRSGAAWTQHAYVKASNPGTGDNFGRDLVLSGDGKTLAVSSYLEDSAATGVGGDQVNEGMKDSGAAYVFVRTDDTWSQQAYVKASNPGLTGRASLSAFGPRPADEHVHRPRSPLPTRSARCRR